VLPQENLRLAVENASVKTASCSTLRKEFSLSSRGIPRWSMSSRGAKPRCCRRTHRIDKSLPAPPVDGLRREHFQSYLDEFVFRFNRRCTKHAAVRSLLGIAVGRGPAHLQDVELTGSKGIRHIGILKSLAALRYPRCATAFCRGPGSRSPPVIRACIDGRRWSPERCGPVRCFQGGQSLVRSCSCMGR
jgi:hypothetical protein